MAYMECFGPYRIPAAIDFTVLAVPQTPPFLPLRPYKSSQSNSIEWFYHVLLHLQSCGALVPARVCLSSSSQTSRDL